VTYDATKKEQRHRFKATDLDAALARVTKRFPESASSPELLAGLIYTLDEKPRPHELTRRQGTYRTGLDELHERAKAERPLTTGPITGAWKDYFDALPNVHALRRLEEVLAEIPNRSEYEGLRGALEAIRQEERDRYRDYRALYRATQEGIAFEDGGRAGAFAYEYKYDPLSDQRRSHMCLAGNFYAEWQIRGCLKRWLDGYREGWLTACRADGANKIGRGLDPDKPQPLPEMNAWLLEALSAHVRSARASAAKYRRLDYVRKNKLRKQLRELYECGQIRGLSGQTLHKRDDAAQAFFDGLTEEDKRLWSRRGDSEDRRDWRAISDLRKALIAAKRPHLS
jgi:hypothetical protein